MHYDLPSALFHDSGRVTSGRGAFWGACVEANTGGSAPAHFYDGDSASGVLIFAIIASKQLEEHIVLQKPIHFEHGLYVDLGSNVEHAIIYWEDYGNVWDPTDPPANPQNMMPRGTPPGSY